MVKFGTPDIKEAMKLGTPLCKLAIERADFAKGEKQLRILHQSL
jgi:hypothetical protein